MARPPRLPASLLVPAALAASLGAAALGCAGPTDGDELAPEDGIVVPDGKEDDFFSLSAYEYVVTGQTSVTLEPELATAPAADKEARVRELIGYKQIAIAWFLTQYLVDKEDDEANAGFGGFGGMAKGGAWDDLDVHAARQGLLKGWLFVHITLSYTLVVLGVLHGVLALAMRGGPL